MFLLSCRTHKKKIEVNQVRPHFSAKLTSSRAQFEIVSHIRVAVGQET